ncbi:MAG: hypothetical protein A2W28_09175 [Gammaproteobacteria bacterium RBG_16_51_14]|nr:MAG: hypothetical protein A2W28_09175 [Gammaproteobacteria bacterium RBG_16_51_14]
MRYLTVWIDAMRCKPILHTSFLLIVLTLLTQPVLARPDLPPPPHATLGRISAKDMVVNGIPMDIRLFRSELSPDRVLNYYRNHWPRGTAEQPGYAETDALPPWQIITRAEGRYLMTVQIAREGTGSSGYLAISELPNPRRLPDLGEGFPKMRGSVVTNEIMARDIDKKGRTIQIMNNYSVSSNTHFYRTYFTNRGWDTGMDRGITGARIHTLTFRDGDKSVMLSINGSDGKQTYIIAQTVNM